jgi:pimeloyl-ACP methyl ester carboxylesterase
MKNVDTVVALHSLFFDGSMFDGIRDRLSTVDFLTPDHLGQGKRTGEEARPSLDRLADDVIELISATTDRPVHLVGSSMGAYVAIKAAARKPELFRTCVLSAASADAEQRPEHFAGLVSRLRSPGPAAMVEDIAYTMFGDDFLNSDSEQLRHWKDHFRRLPKSVANAAHEVFTREDLWHQIAELPMPLLLLAGEDDHAKPADNMARIAVRKPGSVLTVVPGAGHTPFVERPDYVSALLGQWLLINSTQ